jgi:hypothetical protein
MGNGAWKITIAAHFGEDRHAAHNWCAIAPNLAFDQCYSDNPGCNAA